MKRKFIFILLISILVWSCKSSEPPKESTSGQPFEITVQHWFANPDSDSNFTERGIDVTIIFHEGDRTLTPEYVIFNDRKSFTPIITPTVENFYKIEARIILESSLLQQISERVNQTNRLVFTNSDGEYLYIEFKEWETLPNRYD